MITLTRLLAVLILLSTVSGCALAIGAGAAIIADEVVEENGGNLF